MGDLKSAKTMGGIGAILTLIPGVAIVGFVLKILAVKNISEVTKREEIFTKYLWAAILAILASIVAMWSFWGSMFRGGAYGYSMMSFGMATTGVLLAAVLMIVGVWFMKQSYDMISEETGVDLFHTTALLYLVGAILMIVMIGMLLILIAAILEIVAFFSLPDELSKPSEEPAPI
ncbi:DUF996 domain-containing protein [Thermococcus sp.]